VAWLVLHLHLVADAFGAIAVVLLVPEAVVVWNVGMLAVPLEFFAVWAGVVPIVLVSIVA
jgi:hypothetical protein